MNGLSLMEDMKQGALNMNQHPCNLCRKNKKMPGRGHYHWSDWGKCIRAVWFERTVGKNETITPEDAMKLADGHLHEALMLKQIMMGGHKITHRDTKDGEIKKVDRVVVPGGMTIIVSTIGHTDGVMDDEIVIECKAVKDWAWKNKFEHGLIPPTYYGQVQFYLHAHNKDRAFLVVKHRHTSEIMIFEIKRNHAYIARRKLELAGVEVAILQRMAIKVPFDAPTDECRFCSFYNMCWRFGQ